MKRAYYSSPLDVFSAASPNSILGQMSRQHGFDLTGGTKLEEDVNFSGLDVKAVMTWIAF